MRHCVISFTGILCSMYSFGKCSSQGWFLVQHVFIVSSGFVFVLTFRLWDLTGQIVPLCHITLPCFIYWEPSLFHKVEQCVVVEWLEHQSRPGLNCPYFFSWEFSHQGCFIKEENHMGSLAYFPQPLPHEKKLPWAAFTLSKQQHLSSYSLPVLSWQKP